MDLDLFDVFNETKTNLNNLNNNLNINSNIKTKKRSNKRIREENENENEKNEIILQETNNNETNNNNNTQINTLFTEHTEHTLSVTGSDRTLTTILALPADYVPTETAPIIPTEPAKVYPFKLDTFQQEAINCIEKNESVLVAAHTSAGKTVCAEYAIAKSLKNKQRVIYTSPIKALSNQKFRDIQAEFGDVGLMTGDMTINPGATCLIMTTEILRNMLYRGSEVMREVAWVIYDEVHYMRDKERGVVWEESIILLPHKVRFVFLSATIPNAKEFVGWVAKTHHQPCHVVYTDYRPVPLEHYIFPASSEGLFLVVDGKGKFREDNFQRGMAALHPTDELETEKNKKRKKGGFGVESDLFKVVRLIMERELDPCIVFSFSKKDCETYALQMSRLDFNNDDEKNLIEQVFLNAIEALSEDDKRLPQVETLLPLLKKGIGIHHGGLLPILKEIIEILFQEGLIKCLFATETFSIGINMPAKTVVFTQTRKYDGEDFRWITSGEYIQMSGRAGRRGKDDRGIVIQMIDEKMEPDVAKGILYGESDPLYSSYHVSYNMVLNMMRVEDADPEHILRASFYQYQREQKIPEIEQIITEFKQVSSNIHIPSETIVSDYHLMCKQIEKIQYDINKILYQSKFCLPFLQPGRVVMLQVQSGVGSQISKEDQLDLPFLKDEDKLSPVELTVNWGYGIIVNCRKNELVQKSTGTLSDDVELIIGKQEDIRIEYIMDVLVELIKLPDGVINPFQLIGLPSNYLPVTLYDTLSDEIKATLRQSPTTSSSSTTTTLSTTSSSSSSIITTIQKDLFILQFSINTLSNISAVRLTLPSSLRKKGVIQNIYKSFQELKRRFTGATSIPLLDPKSDMSVVDPQYDILLNRYNELTTRLQEILQRNSDVINENSLKLFKKKETISNHIKNLNLIINNKKNIQLKSILKNIKLILKKHHFITVNDVLETKGRFACELNIPNELLLTDLIFDGMFNTISVEQTVSLLSCFVYNDAPSSNSSVSKLRSDFQSLYTQLMTYAKKHYQLRIDLNKKYTETSENELNNSDINGNSNNNVDDDGGSALNPELMEATFLWCCGSKFIDICRVTDVFEGNIIRVIKRLEELLRQLATASSIIGNIELKDKFEEGANKIRRGIIFTSSLYL